MTPQQEILEVSSRSDARKLIHQALSHYRTAKRATIQVMADLRRLQNGGVHLLYGEQNFAVWAESTFDGLAAANVRQLTRAGGVALELERRELLDLNHPEGQVGTTALRELSVISNDFGDDKMAEIYSIARESVEDGREVSATAVKAAMLRLMPPAAEVLETPAALKDEDEDDEDDGYDDAPEHPKKVQELVDRIHDLAWELPEATEEMAAAVAQLQAELTGTDNTVDAKWIESKR